MINISIGLYGKPSWDMDIEGEEITDGEMFRAQGKYLKEHLENVADIVKKLTSAGWSCSGTLYDLQFFKESVINKSEAKKELKRLKIDMNQINVEEYEIEED
ncbi:MAG: hypothetical protein Q8L34_00460 [Candidatus Woesearchaeota archaeon]|nr:hypothetical protein [Candidatus Woesearchaeota archaeon]